MYNPNLQRHMSQNRPSEPAPGFVKNKAQRGFSLIELMVGLTIGLLVVLAAIGSLVFTQVTSSVVDDSARLQQKADAVFRNMGFHVAQAGAFNLATAPSAASSAPELAKVVFSANYTGFNTSPVGVIYNFHGLEGASNTPDTLRVSYEADSVSRDCLGYQPSGTNVDNEFTISGTDLMCKGATGASAQSIADGVEDMQVLYGVQVGLPGAEQYQFYKASDIVDWTNIQAVQVCLQIVGDSKGNPQPSSFVLKGCRGQTLANDGYLRRIFWRTLSSRNALL
jgi:type IV pilus assembly protein PilW